MKYTKSILSLFVLLTIALSLTPAATPQVGTYTFHGAPGNEKVLVVRTANDGSLEIVFGENYTDVLETSFGVGALEVGAKRKSIVNSVNLSYSLDLTAYFLGIYDAASYNTSNWLWTTGSFSETPDSEGDMVYALYDPNNITQIVNFLTFGTSNVTIQNAAAYFAQLPTPVANYLAEIVWAPKWQNVDNTVVHSAEQGDIGVLPTLELFAYYHNCTETWTWDTTYGAWIGYKVVANDTTIYEFSIELPTLPAIPGFEIPILLGATTIGIIYIMKKRK
jgi:hypothetical protein